MFDPPFIESLEGCEEYIAKYMEGRNLRVTDKRQVRQTEKHEKRLEKAIESSETLLKNRIICEYVVESSKCDNRFTNNLHFFNGNGSRLGELPRKPFYALDFAENTSRNRTEFTEHLQNLEVNHTNIDEKWLKSARQFSKPQRSHSMPNLKLTSPKNPTENNRYKPNWNTWSKRSFEIFNIDEHFEIPEKLRTSAFWRELTIEIDSLIDHVEPRHLRPGWQSICSILFSTSDRYFYAILPSCPADLRNFSKFWAKKVKLFTIKPNQGREQWERKNVILFLEQFEEDGTQFRRARHIYGLENENEDWFIEMDTGNLRCLKNAGPNNVMRMPAYQCVHSCNIMECRFENFAKMGASEISREIEKIRKNRTLNIVGFDRLRRRNLPSFVLQTTERSKIKTAIINPIPTPPAPLMTTVFCDNSSCMGCNTWSAFKNPIFENLVK
ncbi:unnamed protein product [Caenorhabditis angaria]|uniref:Uncharacterized protein n=1 Tax=Caenorhabditis angaria TaxID=860376 RepID=A0A9P1IFM0_9PELO|nr:unnamed protein product [Caenorhabditis angaria]